MATSNVRIADPIQSQRNMFLDALMSAPPINQNAVEQFIAVTNASTQGVDISFSIADATGMSSIALVRAGVMDIAQATVLQTWAASVSAFTWSDTDALLQQMGQAFYWLKLLPLTATGSEADAGPQYILLNPSLLPPLPLAAVSASHAAAVNGAVLVTCNASAIDLGDSVKIYVTGYQGNANPVAVAQRSTAPVQFNLEDTAETITITAIAVSPGGAEAASGPTCALTLNSAVTAPAALENVDVVQISTGNQVEWPSSLETGVTGYQLWRGQRGGGFGASSLLATVPATSAGTVIYLDTAGLTGDFEYYAIAVAAAGNSPASPAANPQVLFSSSQVPANVSANTTNTSTLDSIDAGSSATIQIYGPGGVGTSYTRQAGYGTVSRPAGSVTGLAYSTLYYVLYALGAYLASTDYTDTLPDGYEWVGVIATCPPGGGVGGAACSFSTGFDPTGGFNYVATVSPNTIGAGYGSASVTVTGGTFTRAADIGANCSGGGVVSYDVIDGGDYSSMAGLTLTVNLDSPYTGGGVAGGGARYVQTS